MIICNQNSRNTVALTLSEGQYDYTGITSIGYTLTLINDTTNEIFSGITITNLNSGTTLERYDKFYLYLTGQTSINYSTSNVYLPLNGMYTYIVYNNNCEIERGIMKVDGDANITTYTYEKTNMFYSYKNQ